MLGTSRGHLDVALSKTVRNASGARVLDLPLRDERVWKAMQQD